MPETPWYDPGLRFSCTQCGNCCSGPPGYVWFTDAEGQAIARQLGLTLDEFRQRYATNHDGRWSINDQLTPQGYDCAFLMRAEDGRATCAIYEVRPQQCRTWPFWPENIRRPTDWKQIAARCPGVAAGLEGRGNFYPVAQIRIIRAQHPV